MLIEFNNLEPRSEITVKIRMNGDSNHLMELTVDENDTFEAVAMNIREVMLAGRSKITLFYRNKTLDPHHTLKQEKFGGGETLDITMFPKFSNLSRSTTTMNA